MEILTKARMKAICAIAACVFLFALALNAIKDGPWCQGPSFTELRIGSTIICAGVADTETKRKQGLSGRNGLGKNEGMFFVFDTADHHGIWMKDMRFPIDIVWIGEDMRVVAIEKNVSPDTYPQVFYPPTQAKFVLETKAGVAASANIRIGEYLLSIQ